MPWLLREAEVLATVEIAHGVRSRSRGLLGRAGIDGALLLRPAMAVHTLGMQFPIDVAFCDRDMVVLRTMRLERNRLAKPVLRAHTIIEAEAGAFERWRLQPGDQLELRLEANPR